MKNSTKYDMRYAFFTTMKHAPGAVLALLGLNIVSGLFTPLLIYTTAMFLDGTVSFVSGNSDIKRLIISLSIIFTAQIFIQVSGILTRLSEASAAKQLRQTYKPMILKKQAALTTETVENPKTLNLIQRIAAYIDHAIFMDMNCDVFRTLKVLIQTGSIMIIISISAWWMGLLMIAAVIPMLFLSYKAGKIHWDMDRKVSHLSRVMNYYSRVLTNREEAAERKLFGFSKIINERYKKHHIKRTNMNFKAIAIWHLQTKLSGLIMIFFLIGMIILLLKPLGESSLSIGLYISLVGALSGFYYTLSHTVARLFESFAFYKEYMKDFDVFMNLPEVKGALEHYVQNAEVYSVEFINVSFKYPGNEKLAVKNFNFEFRKGCHYSIVGSNGAGKTTITKLMTGLYTVQQGEILINGKPITDYEFREISGFYSMVFQDFARYNISFLDNLTFGGSSSELDKTINKAGLSSVVSQLPNGVDSKMGKLTEGGVDLSGGEWQKVAIARALNKNASFLILDEPTASLSPVAESRIYHQFEDITKDKTTVIISHRLGSTKLSDVILIMDEGELAEWGNHNKLMDTGGIYATMFNKQKEWYHEEL